MKILALTISFAVLLYSSIVTSNGFIYIFDKDGTPKYRIDTQTGFVQAITKYGWVDLRFKEHIKGLKLFKANDFIKLHVSKKEKVITNYFNKEIRPLLFGLNQENIDRLLHIFITDNIK